MKTDAELFHFPGKPNRGPAYLTTSNPASQRYAKPTRLLENPDAIVIGTGIGGLSIASTLAQKKGMKVLNLWSDGHLDTSIDIFVTEPFNFDAEYEQAYVQELIPGRPLRVARLDTLITMKRMAGRGKDLADIAELENIRDARRDK